MNSKADDGPTNQGSEGRVHFVGIAGTGMSALAAHRAQMGLTVSGSDRAFDRNQEQGLRHAMEALGIVIFPQDGSGVDGADRVVTSTAVEAHIPDLARAKELRIRAEHRSSYLASLMADGPSIAIAGTSGKSTTSAMTFHILRQTNRDPSFLGGAALATTETQPNPLGNAQVGRGPLVAEADESDGSLVAYAPEIAVVMNLQRDHMEEDAVRTQFRTLLAQTRGPQLLGADPELAEFSPSAARVGFGSAATLRLEVADGARGWETTARIDGHPFVVPMPGDHNVLNAGFAIAAAHLAGVPLAEAAKAMQSFPGVRRRFERLGTKRGITVVDDYAHNPHKLEAALAAAQDLAPRVWAFWQPHGYGPTRFLRADLVRCLARTLRAEDRLIFAPIHDVGGTARRDIASEDLIEDFAAAGARLEVLPHRDALAGRVAAEARADDLVLLMGARDPSLGAFAHRVLAEI